MLRAATRSRQESSAGPLDIFLWENHLYFLQMYDGSQNYIEKTDFTVYLEQQNLFYVCLKTISNLSENMF